MHLTIKTKQKKDRIIATTMDFAYFHGGGNKSASIKVDLDLSDKENHIKACEKLAKKLGWCGKYIMGGINDGYVFVPASGDLIII